MNGFVLVREILIEDYQRPALIWQQDQKRHTGPASPGLLLMMASRIETLHSHHLYLSREALSTSLVEELCPTVMLVRKLLCWWWWILSSVREIWGSSHRRLSRTCFWYDIKIRKKRHAWLVTMLIDKLQSNGCVCQQTLAPDLVTKLYLRGFDVKRSPRLARLYMVAGKLWTVM